MKITDLTITLHRWEVPITYYTDQFGGSKQIGVVTIKTDEGVEGHSFLGNANQGADEFAKQVLERLKPVVIGRNPLDIGAIWQDLWKRSRRVATHSICAIDVAPRRGADGARGGEAGKLCLDAGVLIRNAGDTLVLSPPLVIAPAEIEEIFAAIEQALGQID